jgi:Domain of unknown function (DUF4112)
MAIMRAPRGLIIDQQGREIGPESFWSDGSSGGRPASLAQLLERLSGTFGLHGAPTRAQRIARLEALAILLDVAFVVPGTRIRYGLEGIIGLVPIVGDLVSKVISLWIVREARALGAPWHVTTRMIGNVALDGVVGLVPFAGDAFDIMFRANVRNVRLLRRWLERQPTARTPPRN